MISSYKVNCLHYPVPQSGAYGAQTPLNLRAQQHHPTFPRALATSQDASKLAAGLFLPGFMEFGVHLCN